MPSVIIVSTGDELLFGTTINTNSSYISSLFFGTNFNVIKHITVGDQIHSIIECIGKSLDEADIVIVTGGLGPTDDDNTVEAVSKIFNLNVAVDNNSNKKIEDYFKSMNFSQNILDSKMSTVPEGAYVIQNNNGLAPGFVVKLNGKTVIAIPGVPAEAEEMMSYSVLPYLEKEFLFYDGMKLTYRMSGIRESDINTVINEINLPDFLHIGITAKSGICDLFITGWDKNIALKETVDSMIKNKFSKYLLSYNAESPEHELVLLLKEQGLTISTSESCTGGLIAKRITDIPGSSEVFKGSIVAYSNAVKKEFLDVSDETLRIYGAVSEETALEMASSIQEKFKTDVSISTTGIAGPGGGTELKPVGTVCFAFKIKDYQHTYTKVIKGNRQRVRTFASLYAINFLRDFLKKVN